MSIENPTLVHFRHFSSLLNNEIRNTIYNLRSTNSYVRNYKPFFAKRTQFQKSQVNINTVETMNYEQKTMNYEIENEPKRTQFFAA
jgi:hypothetical protein